jgi:phosphoenolpyruvate-protein phosphotransferase
MNEKTIKPTKLTGEMLSPGLARGPLFVHHTLEHLNEFYDITEHDIPRETRRLERALERISRELGVLARRIESEIDSQMSEVFEAHQTMLADEGLRDELKKEIEQELTSAGSAVRAVFRRWERRFNAMEASVAQRKAEDMQDLAHRLIRTLAGVHAHELEKMPAGAVLVAPRLLPSDTIFLARQSAAAALLREGGSGSHAALFVRESGLPCITKIADLPDAEQNGTDALVNATEGTVILCPTDEQIRDYETALAARRDARRNALADARQPATTRDGTRITVLANIGSRRDTEAAVANGAEGIGLYRIENVYLGRQSPPTRRELGDELRQALEPARHLPVCVRLLDMGADKPMPFLSQPVESNPALGRRGYRQLREYPDLLDTQLNALLDLTHDFNLSLLVPMITLPSDMQEVRELLLERCRETGMENIPPLGAMIETPAAALCAAEIAKYADFLSFGTNDLTQYTFAADRENAAVDRYFDDTHPAILRLIQLACRDAADKPLSICGELAGRIAMIEPLLRCGIRTLSVAPPLLPEVKQTIRDITFD